MRAEMAILQQQHHLHVLGLYHLQMGHYWLEQSNFWLQLTRAADPPTVFSEHSQARAFN
jgi:hypothetical protein